MLIHRIIPIGEWRKGVNHCCMHSVEAIKRCLWSCVCNGNMEKNFKNLFFFFLLLFLPVCSLSGTFLLISLKFLCVLVQVFFFQNFCIGLYVSPQKSLCAGVSVLFSDVESFRFSSFAIFLFLSVTGNEEMRIWVTRGNYFYILISYGTVPDKSLVDWSCISTFILTPDEDNVDICIFTHVFSISLSDVRYIWIA